MNTICSLVKSIFAFYVMKYLTNPNTITSSDYCGFIIFPSIFFSYFL